MEGMTGEIVFVMLVVGIACIAFICMSKIREKESKLEEMERKRRMEEAVQKEKHQQEEREKEKAEDRELQELKEKLIRTEQKLWELKSKEKYEVLFDKAVMPLQVLLGLAEVPFDTMTADRMDYYLWEVIAEPLFRAVEQADGKMVNGILILSVSKEKFDKEKAEKDCSCLGKTELENYIRENERRLEAGNIVIQKTDMVQGLGSVVEELKKLDRKTAVESNVLFSLAQNVKQLFEKNRIYPMFASDWRLYACPELKKRYMPLNKNSIRYPGLFIEQDGGWDILGANIGMDDCEE